jgi:hypothetical protein
VFCFNDLRVVAEIVQATAEQQTLVGTQAIVFQYEVGIADRQVLWVDRSDDIVGQGFSRDDKTVHRKHDAAQLAFQIVIRVAGNDDGVRRNGAGFGHNFRPVAALNFDDRGLFVNGRTQRYGSIGFTDAQV